MHFQTEPQNISQRYLQQFAVHNQLSIRTFYSNHTIILVNRTYTCNIFPPYNTFPHKTSFIQTLSVNIHTATTRESLHRHEFSSLVVHGVHHLHIHTHLLLIIILFLVRHFFNHHFKLVVIPVTILWDAIPVTILWPTRELLTHWPSKTDPSA